MLETILRVDDSTNSYSSYNNPSDTKEFNDHKTEISSHKRKELTGLKKGLAVSLALLSTLFPIACGKHKKPYIPPQAPSV